MIKPVKEVADKAYEQLAKYQYGELLPVRTGRPFLDEIFGGLLPQDIVAIAGASGGGKSFELARIRKYVMNPENNPTAANYVWLDRSLEMKYISNVLRDLKIALNKTKKKILLESFSQEEMEIVEEYRKGSTDERFFIDEEALNPEEFEEAMDKFLSQHTDKEAVFISTDHIALDKDVKGDKKKAVDGIIEAINRLKKKYPNSYWIILTQLNRQILTRIKDKDIMAMPNRSDVYQSDTIFHIADYVYVTHNPHRLGINQFSRVNRDIYNYLEEYFVEEKNGKVSFDTLGKIFYIVLKMREGEILFRDIFIEEIDIEGKEKYREPKTDLIGADDLLFKRPVPEIDSPVEPNFSINKAFGTPESFSFDVKVTPGEDDPPF